MRVTSNTFTQSFLGQIGRLSTRQYQLQNQAASGQKLTLPEEDPTTMQRVMVLRAQSSASGQYERNIEAHRDVSTANFTMIKSLKKISDRAGEIATLSDGLKSPDELKIYATEIGQLIRQGVQSANAQHRGDYLLGGTRTDKPPFVLVFDAEGGIQEVRYEGGDEVPSTEIAPDVLVSSHLLGASSNTDGPAALIQDSRSGADFFNHLISLQKNLLSGNTEAISQTDRVNLSKDEDNLLFHLGLNGAVQSRLETSLASMRTQSDSIDQQISGEVSADLADTMVQLNQTQVAYQAALQGGARILNLSLLDYLR